MQSSLILRPYQRAAVRRASSELNASNRALLVSPTGSGKTEMIAGIIRGLPKDARVLILQHLVDLVRQNANSIARYLDNREIVTSCAMLPVRHSRRGDATKAQVVIGTIDTIMAQAKYLGRFDMLVIDEAHRAAAGGYLKLAATLCKKNSALKVFGTTATPERSDRRGLEPIFGDLPVVVTLKEMIEDGWLVAPKVYHLPLESIKGFRLAQLGDDADDDAGSSALNVRVVHEEVIRNWKVHAAGRKSVIFCTDVDHAEGLTSAFKDAGVKAETISYRTPVSRRIKFLDEFSRGTEVDVLVNAFLLTEGFNAPACSCVVLLRSFSSKSSLIQAVGRGLRTLAGKRDCIVLDFVAALERHGGEEALTAGTDLRDRRRGINGGCFNRIAYGIKTEIGEGEAELEHLDIGLETAAILREVPIAPPDPSQFVNGKRIISRSEARARGLKYFFTGKPCIHGHVGDRMTNDGHCSPCQKAEEYLKKANEKSRLSYAKHKEKWQAYAKTPEQKELARQRARKHAAKPEVKARVKARLQQDPEAKKRQRERALRWKANHPEKYKESVRKSEAKRKALKLAQGARTARKWTKQEDKRLIQLFSEGIKTDNIARELNRTPASVRRRKYGIKINSSVAGATGGHPAHGHLKMLDG